MLSTEEKKVILRAIRTEAIVIVSQKIEEGIRNVNASDILMRDLCMQTWENAQRRLRSQNAAELLERSKLADFDHMHRILHHSWEHAHSIRGSKGVGTFFCQVVHVTILGQGMGGAEGQEQAHEATRRRIYSKETAHHPRCCCTVIRGIRRVWDKSNHAHCLQRYVHTPHWHPT